MPKRITWAAAQGVHDEPAIENSISAPAPAIRHSARTNTQSSSDSLTTRRSRSPGRVRAETVMPGLGRVG